MHTRKFSRVNFNVVATVQVADRTFAGDVNNLSMSGVSLVTEERLQLGDAADINLTLVGTSPKINISFEGRVSRIFESGMAFVFEKIDIDSYTHLKNIIAYNIDDAEKVMDEIHSSIDEKLFAEK